MLVPRLLSLALLLLETDTEANVAAKVAPGVTVYLAERRYLWSELREPPR